MRAEKQLLLDEIRDQIEQFGSFLIMSYSALNANAANDFRGEIAKIGGNVEVVRKRVLVKAAEAAGVTIDLAALQGHIGLIFTDKDPIETTKAVLGFSKDNDNAVELIGGRFDGQLYDASQIEKLSKLPGKTVMQAQLLGLFEAPMSQTLAVMEALLTSVVYCLDNRGKQEKEKNS